LGIIVEREVKFPLSSWSQGEALLTNTAARIRERRHREVNSLYDFPTGSLRARGQALRVRRARGAAWLTLKEPAPGAEGLKHRSEYESAVGDPEAIERLLEALGMVEQFRYEKYRQTYVMGELEACLDETPIGCYLELEGAPESIHAEAARLGLSMNDGVVLSYPEIYEDYRRRFAEAPAFMVFPGKEEKP
jgi:adenylate cyclase, class 2